MREVGYSESSCLSGEAKKHIQKHTRTYFDEDSIRRDIRKANKMCIKAEDITNLHRNLELQARVSGLLKPETTNNQSIDRLIIIDKTTPLPTDNIQAKPIQDKQLEDKTDKTIAGSEG
jgi:hypothetical protein